MQLPPLHATPQPISSIVMSSNSSGFFMPCDFTGLCLQDSVLIPTLEKDLDTPRLILSISLGDTSLPNATHLEHLVLFPSGFSECVEIIDNKLTLKLVKLGKQMCCSFKLSEGESVARLVGLVI